jgi:sugar lactone lactonase YvrE
MSGEMEIFIDGLGFGEALRWREDRLWFSDMICQTVSSADLAGHVRTELVIDDSPSGLGWLPDGRLLVVSMGRRQLLRVEPNGSVVVHADLSRMFTGRANDMVVSADGTAYVGDIGSEHVLGEPLREGKLAVVHPDGSVWVSGDGLLVPNGSVISPSGETLIVGESQGGRFRAFPISPNGNLGQSQVWSDLGDRHPDGCTLDAEGGIWFADCAGVGEKEPGATGLRARRVVRVLEGGEITDVIETPDTAWACGLGGEDGRTLFVATAPLPPTNALEPGHGRIWSVAVDVPHAGLP